jgi:Domain of unknown function (DUF4349)
MRIVRTGAGRTTFLVPILALVGVIAAACGASASAPAGAQGREVDQSGGAAPSAAAGVDGQPLAPDSEAAAFKDGAKIIRTGSLQLEVADVRASVTSGRSTVLTMGGYIGASQQYSDGDGIVATITYRIPAERWEEALDALRALGESVGEQTDAADVTGQIVDLDARIRNLKASESALVRHLADAGKVSDVLEIEARLSDVRGQIEQLSAQKANLDGQVAYATLTVTYGVEVQAIKAAADRWDPQVQVDEAGASLIGFLQSAANVGIWLAIVGLPILLMLSIVIAIGLFVARRFGFLRRTAAPPPAAAEG